MLEFFRCYFFRCFSYHQRDIFCPNCTYGHTFYILSFSYNLRLWAQLFIYFIQLAPMGAILYFLIFIQLVPMGTFIHIFHTTCTYGHISLFKFIEIAPMCVIIYVNIFLKFLERKLVHQQKSQKQLLKVVSKIKRRLVNLQVLFYYFYFFYISRSISTECFSC